MRCKGVTTVRLSWTLPNVSFKRPHYLVAPSVALSGVIMEAWGELADHTAGQCEVREEEVKPEPDPKMC